MEPGLRPAPQRARCPQCLRSGGVQDAHFIILVCRRGPVLEEHWLCVPICGNGLRRSQLFYLARVAQLGPITAAGRQADYMLGEAHCKMKIQEPSFKKKENCLLFSVVSWCVMCFYLAFNLELLKHRNTNGAPVDLHLCLGPLPQDLETRILEQENGSSWAKTRRWEVREPNWEDMGGRTPHDQKPRP